MGFAETVLAGVLVLALGFWASQFRKPDRRVAVDLTIVVGCGLILFCAGAGIWNAALDSVYDAAIDAIPLNQAEARTKIAQLLRGQHCSSSVFAWLTIGGVVIFGASRFLAYSQKKSSRRNDDAKKRNRQKDS